VGLVKIAFLFIKLDLSVGTFLKVAPFLAVLRSRCTPPIV